MKRTQNVKDADQEKDTQTGLPIRLFCHTTRVISDTVLPGAISTSHASWHSPRWALAKAFAHHFDRFWWTTLKSFINHECLGVSIAA